MGRTIDRRRMPATTGLVILRAYREHLTIGRAAAHLGIGYQKANRYLQALGVVISPGRLCNNGDHKAPLENLNHPGFLRELERRLEAEALYEDWYTTRRGSLADLKRFVGAKRRLEVFELYQELQNVAALEEQLGQKRDQFLPWMRVAGLNLCIGPSDTLEGLNNKKFLQELHRRLQAEAELEELYLSGGR